MKLLKKAVITTSVVLALSACDSMPKMPEFSMPSFGAIDVQRDWTEEALIKTDNCNTFTFENISSFIDTYYIVGQRVQDKSDPAHDALDNYLMSAVLINRANLCLAEALDLDEVIESLKQEKEDLTRGTSMSSAEMDRHRSSSVAASKAISQKLEEIDTIEPEQKEKLTIGISTLIGGTYTFANTYEKVVEVYEDLDLDRNQTWQQWIISAPTKFGKGRVIYFVYGGMPEIGKAWIDSTTNLYEFSQSNDIEVPSDATDMYRDMLRKREMVEEDVAEEEA